MKHVKKYLLSYTLLPLVIFTVAVSYYRFIVTQDYTIGYEGLCDPTKNSCYIYCEDDECNDPLYYSWIERNAGILYEACGGLVTDCDEAYTCDSDTSCTISFCDSETEECYQLNS